MKVLISLIWFILLIGILGCTNQHTESFYSKNGKLVASIEFTDKTKSGRSVYYWENGNKKIETYWENGKQILSKIKLFSENGVPVDLPKVKIEGDSIVTNNDEYNGKISIEGNNFGNFKYLLFCKEADQYNIVPVHPYDQSDTCQLELLQNDGVAKLSFTDSKIGEFIVPGVALLKLEYGDRIVIPFNIKYKSYGNVSNSDSVLALKHSPNDFIIYNNLGAVREIIGDTLGALSDYTKSIEINPNYSYAYNSRGVLKGKLKRYDEALGDLNKAIEIKNDYSIAYANRGNILFLLNKREESLEDFNKSIQLDASYSEGYFNRGVVNLKLGELEQACLDWNKSRELGYEGAEEYISNYCK